MRSLLPRILRALARLSLPALHRLGAGLGRLAAVVPNRLRATARRNLAECFPELTAGEREALARECLAHTAMSACEIAALWNWPGERILALVREVEGREHLDGALAAGRGAIVAMPHLGCWEITNLYCSSLAPVTALYKAPRERALEGMMLAGRQRLGARLVAAGTGGVRALREALARGEIAAILPDQVPPPGGGIAAPFFGRPAYTMTLLARLARRSGAPVVYAYAERLPGGAGFRLRFRPAATAYAELGLEEAVERMNADVEACARDLPAQYQWTYKRFRPVADAPA